MTDAAFIGTAWFYKLDIFWVFLGGLVLWGGLNVLGWCREQNGNWSVRYNHA
jgi:hypothetical protein